MDRRTDARTDAQTDARTDAKTHACMFARTNAQTHAYACTATDAQTDRRTLWTRGTRAKEVIEAASAGTVRHVLREGVSNGEVRTLGGFLDRSHQANQGWLGPSTKLGMNGLCNRQYV